MKSAFPRNISTGAYDWGQKLLTCRVIYHQLHELEEELEYHRTLSSRIHEKW